MLDEVKPARVGGLSIPLTLFLPLALPSLGVFSLAGSFSCLFLLFVMSARLMLLGSFLAWVFFTWV